VINNLKTAFLLGLMTALLLVVGGALGGQAGMVIAFGLAVVMNLGSYWFSHKIVLAMYGAKPVSPEEDPELHGIVDRLAMRAEMPKPAVYRIPSDALNAFATGRNPKHAVVAVTDGLRKAMDSQELEGVLAHELSHVRNRDILISAVAATVAGAIMMMANMARFAAIFGGGRGDDRDGGGGGVIGLLATAIIAPIAAMLIQMAVSRSREFEADASGAKLVGHPYGLARALEKLEQGARMRPMQGAHPATSHMFIVHPFLGGLGKLFSTHPPVKERVQRLLGRPNV
jgi:heat shock protein HtpX